MATGSGHLNPNWRGGRYIASNGYVLIRVGVGRPDVKCKCGCGEVFAKFDTGGRRRRYVWGHNARKTT